MIENKEELFSEYPAFSKLYKKCEHWYGERVIYYFLCKRYDKSEFDAFLKSWWGKFDLKSIDRWTEKLLAVENFKSLQLKYMSAYNKNMFPENDWRNLAPCHSGIYFVWNCEGNSVIYVGQSQDINSRLKSHVCMRLGGSASWITYPYELLDFAECHHIAQYMPILNFDDKARWLTCREPKND